MIGFIPYRLGRSATSRSWLSSSPRSTLPTRRLRNKPTTCSTGTKSMMSPSETTSKDSRWKANIMGCDDRIAPSAFKNGLPVEHYRSQPDSGRGQRGKLSSRNNGRKRNAPPQGGVPTDDGYTKFTISIHQILAQLKDNPWLRRPPPLKGDHDKRSINKYCAFHRTHGHDIGNYRSWKMHLGELVREGHCKELVAKKVIQHIEDRNVAMDSPKKVSRLDSK
ncbi:unnamed protein product, partial [Prunus brigantina]